MKKYRSLVIWSTGERETFDFEDKVIAFRCCENHVKAFGNQIEYTGVDEVFIDDEEIN